jgi:hypothetical protein
LWPDWAPERLWDLLNQWVEWCDTAGLPKSMHLPEAAFRFEIQGGEPVAIGGAGFCLTPGTAPRQPRRVEEFNLAFGRLDKDQKIYVLALVEMQGDAWPGGDQWAAFLCLLKLTPRQFKTLLHDALASLVAFAKARHLV